MFDFLKNLFTGGSSSYQNLDSNQFAEQMKQANLDTNVILFSMWTEAVKNFAEYGKGNIIFLDGSPEGMENNMRQIMAMVKMDKERSNTK